MARPQLELSAAAGWGGGRGGGGWPSLPSPFALHGSPALGCQLNPAFFTFCPFAWPAPGRVAGCVGPLPWLPGMHERTSYVTLDLQLPCCGKQPLADVTPINPTPLPRQCGRHGQSPPTACPTQPRTAPPNVALRYLNTFPRSKPLSLPCVSP